MNDNNCNAARLLATIDMLEAKGAYNSFVRQLLEEAPNDIMDSADKFNEDKSVWQVWMTGFRDHQKIPAIKFIRAITGCGLADAKHQAENLGNDEYDAPLFTGTKEACEDWVDRAFNDGVERYEGYTGLDGVYVGASEGFKFEVKNRG